MIVKDRQGADARKQRLLDDPETARRWARWMAQRTAPLVDGRPPETLQPDLEALFDEWLEQEEP